MTRIEDGGAIAAACADRMAFGVRWPGFPTHFPASRNARAPDRMVKVSGQSLFSGSLHRMQRSMVVASMKGAMMPLAMMLKRAVALEGIDIRSSPWRSEMVFRVHPGYGSVRMMRTRRGVVIRGGDDALSPNWDIDNQWVWHKVWKDACVLSGLLPADDVSVIAADLKAYSPCASFAERSITFVFRAVRPAGP